MSRAGTGAERTAEGYGHASFGLWMGIKRPARGRRRELSAELAAFMAEVNVVLTATSVGEASPIAELPSRDGLEVPGPPCPAT